MNLSRRQFIKKSGGAVLASTALAQALSACSQSTKERPFGINLWTVRDDMASDPMGVLKTLAEYGYKQIESFTGEKGIFWGIEPKEFHKFLNDIGIKMISSHVNPQFTTDPGTEDEYKALLANSAPLGVTHFFNPYPGSQKSTEDWKKIAEGLNRQGKISKEFGIKSGYHNHHQEFKVTPEGDLPYEILLKETDPALVDFEMDLYWVVKAGHDPEKWFNTHPGRFTFAHFKDLYKNERVKEIEDSDEPRSEEWPVGASTFLGNGQIDFAKILKTGEKAGLANFIVEQERFDNSTPLDESKKNAEFMRKLLA